jgi:ABC-2 type transport system permease protein
MLVDAIRAEGFRLTKNRTAVFWSVVFVPILILVIGALTSFVLKGSETKLLGDTKTPPQVAEMLARGTLDLGEAMVTAAGNLANPLVLLFVLIGAATLYAGDYRWETWRLISARNSRSNLILAKLAVVAGLALAAMAFMLIGSAVENLIKAAVFERTLAFTLTGDQVGQFFLLAGLSWLRIVQFAMVSLLAAVLTRSLLAALFIPLVVGVAQFFTPQLLGSMGVMPDAWLAVLLNPAMATDVIQGVINGPAAAAALPAGLALKAWTSLGLWTLLPLAGALAWFQRQDLSKE